MAITNVLLWFTIWTPYACVTALPALGYQATLTPLVSQIPSFAGKQSIVNICMQCTQQWIRNISVNFMDMDIIWTFAAKTACCINPIVYAVSHPKFREAMAR